MIRLFLRALGGRLRSGRSLHLLTVGGVALGVAAVLSIQLLNRSALGAFQGGLQAVGGAADLSVLGTGDALPERLYPEVLSVRGVRAAWPLYRIDAAVLDRPGFFLEVVGFDFFADVERPPGASGNDPAAPLTVPGWVAVSPELAREMGWSVGDPVEVASGSRRARLTVGALVDFRSRSPLAPRRLALMDLSQAQSLLGRPGRLHEIQVRAAGGVDPEDLASRLAARLGPAARVTTPEQRRLEASSLLGAFRLNLTALSLISLLVGAFLVHGSTQASLVRRRAELGLLRSLGMTRGRLVGLLLAEVTLLAAVGAAAGVPLGYAAAAANLETVSRTVSGLYLLQEIDRLHLSPGLALLACAVGLAGALAGAVLPALDLGRADPRALLAAYTLHEKAGAGAGRLFAAGAGLLALGAAAYALLSPAWRPAGFVPALAVVLALPLLTPLCVRTLAGRVRPRGFGPGYSLRTLAARLHGTTFTVASLAVAVTMLVGITVMVGSFRHTVETWIGSTLRADLYLSGPAWSRTEEEAGLDDDLVAAIARLPEVRRVDRFRRFTVWAGGRRVAVAGIDLGIAGGEDRFSFLSGEPREAVRRARDEGAVLVSEPLARAAAVGVGDALALPGPRGAHELTVAGIFRDYGNEGGLVMMDLEAMAARWGPGLVQSIALYLDPAADPERTADALRVRFPDRALRIRSDRRLREDVMTVFDETFAVTRLLQGICLTIAVAGITLTLLVAARERVSELALYRSLGAGRRQIGAIFVGKGVGIAVLALILGLAGGGVLALILIFAINRDYFGWTLALRWPWASLAVQAAGILAAAAAAALYPALRASRTPAAELSREEVA